MSETTKTPASMEPLSASFASGPVVNSKPWMTVLPVLFFVSGATALAAQVVLNRLLTYVFGSSHLATATVLAAYMAGLSVGAFLFGRLTLRLRRPILVYGILELSVALFFVMVPLVFQDYWELGLQWGRAWATTAGALTFLRFGLSFSLVFVPTVLMGGTLPTLLAGFGGRDLMERHLPRLYALNTMGGALGTLASGYVSIFYFGLDGTLRFCALANAGVALVSFLISSRVERKEVTSEVFQSPAVTEQPENQAGPWGLTPRIVCLLAFLQGALAFTLEVVWTHVFRTAIGVTTYAFTNMLTAILLGIGLGSLLFSRLTLRRRRPLLTFYIWAQLLLALSIVASLFFWDRFPDVIQITRTFKYHWSFAEREAIRFVFCLLLLLPATIALGIALPALTASGRMSGSHGKGKASAFVGLVFAANTAGAIVGALVCGFGLLGRVDADHIIVVCSGVALVLAAVGLAAARGEGARSNPRGSTWSLLGLAAAACGVLIFVFPGWNLSRLTAGSHYAWDFYTGGRSAELLFFQEDAQNGFVTVERLPTGMKVMKSNGKYEGSDDPEEFQQNFALIGAQYLRRFERAALVGLGPGRTLAFLYEMPFQSIEVVEHSPAIVAAAREEFPEYVGDAFRDRDRVKVYVDDGRNHLQLAPSGYDYIAVGITGAAFSGVGSLYSRDFFHVVRQRLRPSGVFVLWIQAHHVLPEDVRSVIYTLRDVFPHVHFYADRTQGYLVASSSPLTIDPRVAAGLEESPRIRRLMEWTGMHNLHELLAMNVFATDEELEKYFQSDAIEGSPVLYTDFNPEFEFTTPMGLATDLFFVDFSRFSARKFPEFEPPLTEAELAGLSGLRLLSWNRLEEARRQFEKAESLLGRPVWQKQLEEIDRVLQ